MPARKTAKRIQAIAGSSAINLLALALLIWAGLDLYQRIIFHQDWKKKQEIKVPATALKVEEKMPKNTLQVAQQHLFGQKQQVVKPVEVIKAPATRLNLKLIGVIAVKEEGVSKVIIQIGNADIGVYSVGDSLPKGNAIIERIEAKQVLLKRNGKLESLAIIRPELEEKKNKN